MIKKKDKNGENCLSKSKQCQSLYDRKSQFLKSTEWAVIINKLKLLLNKENKNQQIATKTSAVILPEVIHITPMMTMTKKSKQL